MRRWYDGAPGDWLSQVLWMDRSRPRVGGNETLVPWATWPWEDWPDTIEEYGLDALTYRGEAYLDLYLSVGFLWSEPDRGKRGGIRDVRGVPGVWLDLDVKNGAFSSENDALEFARGLGWAPTILVTTGTGGVHAYWKTPEILDTADCAELCRMWYEHAQSRAGEIGIDKLCNPDRIMRLPGSIRWPKKPEEPISVSRVVLDDGPIVHPERLREIALPAWHAHQERVTVTRRRIGEARLNAHEMLNSGNRWHMLEALSEAEDSFNARYTWDDVLLPFGWTKLGTDHEHRVLWSRPGDGARKSATTDWPQSPDVMSLFSTAPETGLLELYEAGVVLTKYRVWIQLAWRGDEEGFIRSYAEQMRNGDQC